MYKNVMDLIAEEKIYPIVRHNDAQKAVDIAHALIEGGIKVLEITIENPSLYSAISEVSKDATVFSIASCSALEMGSMVSASSLTTRRS